MTTVSHLNIIMTSLPPLHQFIDDPDLRNDVRLRPIQLPLYQSHSFQKTETPLVTSAVCKKHSCTICTLYSLALELPFSHHFLVVLLWEHVSLCSIAPHLKTMTHSCLFRNTLHGRNNISNNTNETRVFTGLGHSTLFFRNYMYLRLFVRL